MFTAWWIRPALWLLGSAVFAGLFSLAVHRYNDWIREPLEEKIDTMTRAIDKQKFDAAQLLKARIAENAAAVIALTAHAQKADDEHAKQIAAIRTAAANDRVRILIDPGRGQSGCSARETATGVAGTPQSEANGAQLSRQADDFLLAEATRADELAVWANSCWSFVNSK